MKQKNANIIKEDSQNNSLNKEDENKSEDENDVLVSSSEEDGKTSKIKKIVKQSVKNKQLKKMNHIRYHEKECCQDLNNL